MKSLITLCVEAVSNNLPMLYNSQLLQIQCLPADLKELVLREQITRRETSDLDLEHLLEPDATELHFSNTHPKVSDRGILAIQSTSLKDFKWINGNCSSSAIAQLVQRNAMSLRKLCLVHVELTDVELRELISNCSDLTHLAIRCSRVLNNQHLQQISRSMPSLVSADFRLCKSVSDRGVKELAASVGNRLKELSFGYSRALSDDGLLSVADNCPNLEKFSIEALPRISGEGIAKLLSKCPQIHELYLRDCQNVDNKMFEELDPGVGKLNVKRLDIMGCYNMNKIAARLHIAELMPQLVTPVLWR